MGGTWQNPQGGLTELQGLGLDLNLKKVEVRGRMPGGRRALQT